MFWAMLLLLAQAVKEDTSGISGIRYLLRHQMEDGSWGGVPAGCRCRPLLEPPPPGLAVDEATRRLVTGLIGRFRDDDIAVRQRAQSGLLEIGGRAAPQLWESLRDEDPEVAGRCREVLLGLGRNERGKGAEGTTALALLCFVSAGYSHLSKDTYDGRCVGTTVVRGLQWLKTRQDAHGAFSRDPVENAMAALTLMEAYGYTGSKQWKDSAIRGCASLLEVKSEGSAFLLWKGMAFKSWELSGTDEVPPPAFPEIAGTLAGRQGALDLAGTVLMGAFARRPPGGEEMERLCAVDPSRLDPLELYITAAAVVNEDPRGRSDWRKRAKEALRAALKDSSARCREGVVVRDEVRARSLQLMTLWCLWSRW